MSLRSALYTQPSKHGAPLQKLSLHLSLDVKGMVGDSLCSSALLNFSFELQYASIEGKVVGEKSAAFALE